MTVEVPSRKRLVLDANILLRAVLGVRVRGLLKAYEDSVDEDCRSLAQRQVAITEFVLRTNLFLHLRDVTRRDAGHPAADGNRQNPY